MFLKDSLTIALSKIYSFQKQKVALDYNDTFTTRKGFELAKRLLSEGKDVHIVTRLNERNRSTVEKAAAEAGIPGFKVHFTNGKLKWDYLKRNNFDVLYDNNPDEIAALKENAPNVKGIVFVDQAKIGPRGGIVRSPKAPDYKERDGKRGSKVNKPGAASNQRGKLTIPASVEKALQTKADEFNKRYKDKLGYGVTISQLKSVYQRGVGAFQTGSSSRVSSPEQWGQARVNAFLYVVKNGRPENKNYTQDNDLLPSKHPKKA